MASLNLTNAEVYEALGHLLAISRDPERWDPTTAADANRIIRSGRRRFFSAHPWNFLNDDHDIVTAAPYATGTIEVVDGVVTLTGGTFPTDATQYVLIPDDGGVYTIESRDSGTQVTLHDTSLDVDALTEFNLYKVEYDLPTGFGAWEGPITIDNDTEVKESRNFPEYLVRSVAGQRRPRTGRPELFTVVSNLSDATAQETGVPVYVLRVYPLPDEAYVLSTRYKVAPGDTLDLATDVPTTHPIFAEAMLEAILSAAEVIAFDAPGVHTQSYQVLIEEAKKIDGRANGVRFARPRHMRRGRNMRLRELIDAPVVIDE